MNFVTHNLALILVIVLQLFYVKSTKSRSANIALETVLDFNNEDLTHDIKTIDQLQHFLKRLKTHVLRNSKTGNTRRNRAMSEEAPISEDDLDDLVNELLKYNDDELESIMGSINKEIKNCQLQKKCPFKEVFLNKDVNNAKVFGDKVQDYVRKFREFLVNFKNNIYDGLMTVLVAQVKKLTHQGSQKAKNETKEAIKKLKSGKKWRSHNDSVIPELYRKAFKTLIIDQYQQMDETTRNKFINEIQKSVKVLKNGGGNSTDKDGVKSEVNLAAVKGRKHVAMGKRYKVKNSTSNAKERPLKKSREHTANLSPKIMREEYNAVINLGANFKDRLFKQLKKGPSEKKNVKHNAVEVNRAKQAEDSSYDGLRIENFAAVPVVDQNSRRLVPNVTTPEREKTPEEDKEHHCTTPQTSLIEPVEFDNRRSAVTPFISDSDGK